VKYEWDETKRQANIQKHGIDFIEVPEMFESETVIVEDTRYPYNEQRYIAIGLLKGRIIVVAYTERGEVIRLISARKATKNEQINYFEQLTN